MEFGPRREELNQFCTSNNNENVNNNNAMSATTDRDSATANDRRSARRVSEPVPVAVSQLNQRGRQPHPHQEDEPPVFAMRPPLAPQPRCRHPDWEHCEQIRLRDLEEARERASQMEKTMRWWSDCTASWREKWNRVRAERNSCRDELRQLKQLLEAAQLETNQLKQENGDVKAANIQLQADLEKLRKEKAMLEGLEFPPHKLPNGCFGKDICIQCYISDQPGFSDSYRIGGHRKIMQDQDGSYVSDEEVYHHMEEIEDSKRLSKSLAQCRSELRLWKVKYEELQMSKQAIQEELNDMKALHEDVVRRQRQSSPSAANVAGLIFQLREDIERLQSDSSADEDADTSSVSVAFGETKVLSSDRPLGSAANASAKDQQQAKDGEVRKPSLVLPGHTSSDKSIRPNVFTVAGIVPPPPDELRTLRAQVEQLKVALSSTQRELMRSNHEMKKYKRLNEMQNSHEDRSFGRFHYNRFALKGANLQRFSSLPELHTDPAMQRFNPNFRPVPDRFGCPRPHQQ